MQFLFVNGSSIAGPFPLLSPPVMSPVVSKKVRQKKAYFALNKLHRTFRLSGGLFWGTFGMLPALSSPPSYNASSTLLLLSILSGLKDQPDPVIAQATHVEQTLARNLQEAYEEHTARAADRHYSAQNLRDALTAAEHFEHEHGVALEYVQGARKHQQQHLPDSSGFLSSLLNGLKEGVAGWFGSSEKVERHYTEIAHKIASRLQELRNFRDSLIDDSTDSPFLLDTPPHTSRRLLLQEARPSVPQQQYYCQPTGACDLDQISNGISGFALKGENLSFCGGSVSIAGDVNGDGFADIIAGAVGRAYVIFGSNNASWGNGILKLPNFTDGERGVVLQGPISSNFTVSAAGDVNGDGLADIVVGAPSPNSGVGMGKFYVVFGSNASKDWGSGNVDIDKIMNDGRGFVLQGGGGMDIDGGFSASTAGDFNGDGISDILIGGPNVYNTLNPGIACVIFGANSTWAPGVFNISHFAFAPRGFCLGGAPNEFLGFSVSPQEISMLITWPTF